MNLLERLKAVRYTAGGETIVQASRITPELAAILKKLDISKSKPILSRSADPARPRSAARKSHPDSNPFPTDRKLRPGQMLTATLTNELDGTVYG